MTSNKKIFNYKIVDLVESYNFHIKFIAIWIYMKMLQKSQKFGRKVIRDASKIDPSQMIVADDIFTLH